MRRLLSCLLPLVVVAAAPAQVQIDRRDRQNPELIVEAGGRLSTCDQLKFTPKGDYLLAVGDDKVVRLWRTVGGRLDDLGLPPMRWSTWREQRGAIYAVDVSADGRRVVIAGYGMPSTAVVVLDRVTGRFLNYSVPETVKLRNGTTKNYYAVRTVAFAPGEGSRVAFGSGDGSIFLWNLADKTPRVLGRHEPGDGGEFNQIRLVHFESADSLLSVAEDGSVRRWDLSSSPVRPRPALTVKSGDKSAIYRAVVSPDGKWLAAVLNNAKVIALRSLDGEDVRDIPLDKDTREFARSVAFSPDGQRLAVALGTLQGKIDDFYLEDGDDRIVLYDLRPRTPRPTPGPGHNYRAEYLTFHPTENWLAVAGGDNHEVRLWDLDHPKVEPSVKRSDGACIWDVALSKDGMQVGWREQRNPSWRDVNNRGAGAWRVFDLKTQNWARAPAGFKPIQQERELGGWSVRATADPYVWKVVDPDGRSYPLETRRDQDLMPRCWAFVPPARGKPLRLLVGHYYGVSEFELRRGQAPRRSRLFTGHSGEVTAIAVSADQTWFLTASNDQTLSAWSFDEWPSQAVLGAVFVRNGKRLVVDKVDPLSPAWEAGLVVGDQVLRLFYNGQALPDDPAAWLERLQDPKPGYELFFEVKRDGKKDPVAVLTTVRQRPLWRFFPTRRGEWVLWMWRHSFYASSTNGDRHIGWHVNNPDPAGEPTFFPAERFRDIFEQREALAELVTRRDPIAAVKGVLEGDASLKPLRFDKIEPYAPELTTDDVKIGARDLTVKMRATPRVENPDYEMVKAALWVNDYRVMTWTDFKKDWRPGDKGRLSLSFDVTNDKLRTGKNTLTFQTFNRIGARSDATVVVECERKGNDPRLFGLTIGIDDYPGTAKGARGETLGKLKSARSDAEAIKAALDGQTKLFKKADVTKLLDDKADREGVLKALDDLAARARKREITADDVLIVFLAGHGTFYTKEVKKGEKPQHPTFVFCPPKFDPKDTVGSGISSEQLAEKLAALPCRKLVLLDACHSGAAASNPVRDLTPAGQGPIILAACDQNQSSWEDVSGGHGLFTTALLEALGGKIEKGVADPYRADGSLDVDSMYHYAEERLPSMLKGIGKDEYEQTPTRFPESTEPLTIAKR
jgi:WD40 repeat protein